MLNNMFLSKQKLLKLNTKCKLFEFLELAVQARSSPQNTFYYDLLEFRDKSRITVSRDQTSSVVFHQMKSFKTDVLYQVK